MMHYLLFLLEYHSANFRNPFRKLVEGLKPKSLSKAVVTDILREEMNYKGVIYERKKFKGKNNNN